MSTPPNAMSSVTRREVVKVTVAALLGTSLEFYDWGLFGFVAPVFAQVFFPSSSPTASLLLTFAAYAVGFFTRPLGALVFGHLGDRIGRRYTLVITLFLMGVVSLCIALLPTYQEVGLLAPLLLVGLRLLMGLSVGGESGTGATITGEFAPKEQRGFWVGISQMSQGLGPLITVLCVGLLSSAMGASGFAVTGWRILFGGGVLIALLGVWIRLGIAESPLFRKKEQVPAAAKVPLLEVFSKYWKPLLLGIGLSMFGTVMAYLSGSFAVSYMILVSKVSLATASLITAVGALIFVVFCPLGGWLADRFGRRPPLITGMLGLLLFMYPYFVLLSSGGLALMILAQAVVMFLQSLTIGGFALLTELFPTRVRVSGVSLSYQLVVAIFGGTTPMIATYLLLVTRFHLAPMIWGFAALLTSILVMAFGIKETKGIDLVTIK